MSSVFGFKRIRVQVAKYGTAFLLWLEAPCRLRFGIRGQLGARLKTKVDDLSEKGLLPRVMKEWATELRLLGNEAAHPDVDLIEANPQDIRDGLKFLDQLLSYLYDLPAAIRDRERRAEKQ
jgi:hypothetical protein